MTVHLEAPIGWHTTRIDRIATVRARIGWKALTADEYVDDGYVFLATPNIKRPEIDFANVNRITRFRYEESPGLKLERGDVLLAKDGNTLGITNVVSDLPEPATVNGSIAILRPSAIEPRYLRYWLASRYIQETIGSLKDGMGVPHLFQRDINRLPIFVPPLDEQRRIADFLDTEATRLDALSDLRARQAVLTAEQLSQAIDAELNRHDAPLVRLKHLLARRLEYGAGEAAEHTRDDWPRYVRTTDVASDGSLRPETFRSLPPNVARPFMLTHGDLLFTRSGATVGKSFLYSESWGPCAYAGYLIRARVNKSRVLPEYVAHFCQSKAYWSQIREGTVQSTIQNVNAERYGNLVLPVPDLETQRGVTARLAAARATHRTLERQVARQMALLGERRQALITAAVTGQLDVTTSRPAHR
jgi:type I restriction enzyme S subunit